MIVGIDLGTTNSAISYFTAEGAKLIPNSLGEYLTPSVVSVDEDNRFYIGKVAKERKVLYPNRTADVFKRSIGTNKVFDLGNMKFSAEELSSFILRRLKEDAEIYLGETVEEAIISVPAYFNDMQRKATRRAGELAGLKVERIISEPTAAAISYGLYQKNPYTKFLVFDLGGGTFDVSVLERAKNILEVRAVAGDNYLGGEDFTETLFQIFMKKMDLDMSFLEERTILEILRQAEICKLGFSENVTSTFRCKINGELHEVNITSEEYEEACQPLLNRIRKPIEKSLRDANMRLSDIDEIVLVGGATKMPMIRKFVGKIFGMFPNFSINPDETVALGVALEVAIKERKEEMREIIMTDVCPFTLGTSIVVQTEPSKYQSGYYLPIIERNTVIPVSRTERLYTVYDNQTEIVIDILQGESRMAKNNLKIGEIKVNVPKAKAGEEAIDVTYTYDINSLLEVIVKVISLNKTTTVIIQSEDSLMTEEEAQKRMEELSYLKIHPREDEENKLLLYTGERLYERSTGKTRMYIGQLIRDFENVLDRQYRQEIEEERKKLKEELSKFEEEL